MQFLAQSGVSGGNTLPDFSSFFEVHLTENAAARGRRALIFASDLFSGPKYHIRLFTSEILLYETLIWCLIVWQVWQSMQFLARSGVSGGNTLPDFFSFFEVHLTEKVLISSSVHSLDQAYFLAPAFESDLFSATVCNYCHSSLTTKILQDFLNFLSPKNLSNFGQHLL